MQNRRSISFIAACLLGYLAFSSFRVEPPLIFEGAVMCVASAYALVRGIYLHLLETEAGRHFLRKLPFKFLKKRVNAYENGDRYAAGSKTFILQPIFLTAIFLASGISNWNHPHRTSNALSIYEFIIAGVYVLLTAFNSLYFFPKGRAFLKRFSSKTVQERLALFE